MHPYFSFYFSALTKYKVHSPFVFEFVTEVFEDDRFYHSFGIIENYRRYLINIDEKISIDQKKQAIKQLVKHDEITASVGKILFKTVHLYKPNNLLELNTQFGIATLYQATPNSNIPVISIEQNLNTAQKTVSFFQKLGTKNIKILSGSLEDQLPKAIQQFKTVDFVYFNHFWGKERTSNYFEQCLAACAPNSIFVFKSPYSSKESIAFWELAKKNPKVRLSIDIYSLGFLFFRSEQKEVAHYKLIQSWKKPWAIY